jgi:hypothetical protein
MARNQIATRPSGGNRVVTKPQPLPGRRISPGARGTIADTISSLGGRGNSLQPRPAGGGNLATQIVDGSNYSGPSSRSGSMGSFSPPPLSRPITRPNPFQTNTLPAPAINPGLQAMPLPAPAPNMNMKPFIPPGLESGPVASPTMSAPVNQAQPFDPAMISQLFSQPGFLQSLFSGGGFGGMFGGGGGGGFNPGIGAAY